MKAASAETMRLPGRQRRDRSRRMSVVEPHLMPEAGLLQLSMQRSVMERERETRAEPVMLGPDDDAVQGLTAIFDLELRAPGQGVSFDQRALFGKIAQSCFGGGAQHAGDRHLYVDGDAFRPHMERIMMAVVTHSVNDL